MDKSATKRVVIRVIVAGGVLLIGSFLLAINLNSAGLVGLVMALAALAGMVSLPLGMVLFVVSLCIKDYE